MEDKINHLIDNHPEKDKVEKEILEVSKDVLEYKELDPEDDFFALGVDSVFLIQVIGRINDRFGTNLSIVDLFKNSSIKKVSRCVLEHIVWKELSEEEHGEKNES